MRLIAVSLFLGLFLPLFSFGQLNKKLKEHGVSRYQKGDYQNACRYFKSALELDSSNAEVNFLYARSLHAINNYELALHHYRRTLKLDKNRSYVTALHYRGEIEKILGHYEKAFKAHRLFVKRYKGNKDDYVYRKSKYEIDHQAMFSRLRRDSSNISLSNNHPVNTANSEFAPFITGKDQMIFSTLRSDSLNDRRVLDTALYYARLYYSKFNETWQSGLQNAEFSPEEKLHVANAVYNRNRSTVYYTECTAEGQCQIFTAQVLDSNWSGFKALPDIVNTPGYTTTQPSLARIDGFDYLFFVSDRPGGKGKLDIWYTIAYSNGLFEEPVNLGDSINSPGNDLCPFFIEEESSFYFSSDWYMGFGGFDIFKSRYENSKFTGPENPGQPVNSSYNDLYFRYGEGIGVLASNREGSVTDKYENCCNDLYFFDYKPFEIVTESELDNLEKIERVLPLKLFFENDHPNPRTEDTTTSVLYGSGFINYTAQLPKYQREYSKGLKGREKEQAEDEISDFFESQIKPAYGDLKYVLNLILKELEKGEQLEIAIKGYASPLSASDYNRKLTLRRIASIENEIRHYQLGVLRAYLNSGQLKILREPYGEDRSSSKVSDDQNDKRNAIYSKHAIFERRVEIIRVTEK